MKNPFSVVRAVLAATASLAMSNPRAALARLRAGNILLNAMESTEFTPQGWLQTYMAHANDDFKVGFERAPKRAANVGYQRRQPTRRRGRINYRKQQNRVARALLKFHGAVAGMDPRDQLAVYGTAVY